LLLALVLDGVSSALVQAASQCGLLINAPREDALRFIPALNVTRAGIPRSRRLARRSVRGGSRPGLASALRSAAI
jgi:acetylornithine/succinyldiaminopimelate/putrescine aminotransferase